MGVYAGLLAILVVFFCNFQSRREKVTTQPSRIAVLLDTSLSMELPQSTSAPESRFQLAKAMSANIENWRSLARDHEIRFYVLGEGEQLREVARIDRREPTEVSGARKNRHCLIPAVFNFVRQRCD